MSDIVPTSIVSADHATLGENSHSTSSKSRNFVFTWNNYKEEEVLHLRTNIARDPGVSWLLFGRERGVGGTPHLQGAISFVNARSSNAVRKFLGVGGVFPWVAYMRGTPTQAGAYCKKEGSFDEFGAMPGESVAKRKLSEFCQETLVPLIRESGVRGVVTEYPDVFLRYHNGIKAIRSMQFEPRDWRKPPRVIWIHGPTGVGKTQCIHMHFPPDQIYVKNDTKWWDGYEQQKCILLDDFRATWPWNFTYLLTLLDKYPMKVEVKGGMMEINSPFIVITCNDNPTLAYQNVQEDLTQLERRITKIVHFKGEDNQHEGLFD